MIFGSRMLVRLLGLALMLTVGGCSLHQQSCCCDRKDVGLVTVRGSITNTRVLAIPAEGLALGHAVTGLATTETQQLVSYATQTASQQDFDNKNNAVKLLSDALEQADANPPRIQLPKLRAILTASTKFGIEPPPEIWGPLWFEARKDGTRLQREFTDWLNTKQAVGQDLIDRANTAFASRNEREILNSLIAIKAEFKRLNPVFPLFNLPGTETPESWASKLAAPDLETSLSKNLTAEQKTQLKNLSDEKSTIEFFRNLPKEKLPSERIDLTAETLLGREPKNAEFRKLFRESIQSTLKDIHNPAKANEQNRSSNSGIIETNIVRLQRANGENLVMPLGMAKEGAASAIMLQDGDTVHCLTMAEMPEIDGGSTGFGVSQDESFGIANIAILNRNIEGSKFTYIVPLENLGASAARRLEYDYFRNNFKVAEGESAVLHTLELQPGVIKGLAMQRRLIRDAAMKAIEKEEGYAKQVVHKTADTGKAVAAADRELSAKIPVVRDIKAICRQSFETASNSVKSASSSLGF